MWVLIVVLGIIAFLAMEHPIALWLVFVPLGVLFISFLVGWLKNSKARLSGLIVSMLVLVTMVIALLFVCSI